MKRVIKSSVSRNKSIRPQYHGSDNPNLSIDSIEIENRNFSEPGFHCGTYEQAVNRITTKYSKGYLYEVVIHPRNILYLAKDLDIDWGNPLQYIKEAINPNDRLLSYQSKRMWSSDIVPMLLDSGYDCVCYPNAIEGPGNSYIVLDTAIVKSMKFVEEVSAL